MIIIFDQVVKYMYEKRFIEPYIDADSIDDKIHKIKKRDSIMVSITDVNEVSLMRSLNHQQINRLICFRGIVIRCSEIYP